MDTYTEDVRLLEYDDIGEILDVQNEEEQLMEFGDVSDILDARDQQERFIEYEDIAEDLDDYMRDIKLYEVDDIDDEVYYQEMLGCVTKAENGDCATLDCGQGEFRVCQKPGSTNRRMAPEPACVGSWCGYAC